MLAKFLLGLALVHQVQRHGVGVVLWLVWAAVVAGQLLLHVAELAVAVGDGLPVEDSVAACGGGGGAGGEEQGAGNGGRDGVRKRMFAD